MTLFKELDFVRKLQKEKRFSLETSALTENRRKAKAMMMKYEDMLVATTDLFGPKFIKKIDKEKGSSSNKGLERLGKSFD